jgi:hypothetical protein
LEQLDFSSESSSLMFVMRGFTAFKVSGAALLGLEQFDLVVYGSIGFCPVSNIMTWSSLAETFIRSALCG